MNHVKGPGPEGALVITDGQHDLLFSVAAPRLLTYN